MDKQEGSSVTDNVLWTSFRRQVEQLFINGYQLPEPLHVQAIDNIEGHLGAWKSKIPSIQPKDCGNKVIDKNHGNTHEDEQTCNDIPLGKLAGARRLKEAKGKRKPTRKKETSKRSAPPQQHAENPEEFHPPHGTCTSLGDSKISAIGQHSEEHSSSEFTCHRCSFKAATRQMLEEHMQCDHRQHNKHAGEKFTCKDCERSFKYVQGLRAHVKIHKNGPLRCSHCSKEFLSKSGFDAHEKLHKGDVLNCPQVHCTFTSGNLSGLNCHMKRVHEKPQEHLCDICGQGFVTKHGLKKHHESVHLDESARMFHQCPNCTYKTYNKSNLTTHVNNVHGKVAGFTCNICGVSLKYKASLQNHQKRHTTSNKQFTCNECSYKGTSEKDLKRHVKRKHCNPTIKCDLCGKLFKEQYHLLRHRVIHTGVKAFSCSHCSYKCNVKGNLVKHVLNVHKVRLPRVRPIIKKIDQSLSVGEGHSQKVMTSLHAENSSIVAGEINVGNFVGVVEPLPSMESFQHSAGLSQESEPLLQAQEANDTIPGSGLLHQHLEYW